MCNPWSSSKYPHERRRREFAIRTGSSHGRCHSSCRKEDEMTRTADIISRPSLACEEMDCIGEAVLKAEMFVKSQSEELRRNKIESETSLKHLDKSSAQQQARISASLESESLNVENALKEAESLQGEAINATLEAIDNLEEARIAAKDSTRLEVSQLPARILSGL